MLCFNELAYSIAYVKARRCLRSGCHRYRTKVLSSANLLILDLFLTLRVAIVEHLSNSFQDDPQSNVSETRLNRQTTRHVDTGGGEHHNKPIRAMLQGGAFEQALCSYRLTQPEMPRQLVR